jgi:hypothetical protein
MLIGFDPLLIITHNINYILNLKEKNMATCDYKIYNLMIYCGIMFAILSIISILLVIGAVYRKKDRLKEIMGKVTIVQLCLLITTSASGISRMIEVRKFLSDADFF